MLFTNELQDQRILCFAVTSILILNKSLSIVLPLFECTYDLNYMIFLFIFSHHKQIGGTALHGGKGIWNRK